ncbi:hypothetical protein ACFXOY_04615 [Streptomyces niveus]|uniref:hypothetical protein n=1 Tax=Streptomyces niveus TaxID=193462 RepID=UPI0036994F4D
MSDDKALFAALAIGAIGAGAIYLVLSWIEHEQGKDPTRSTTTIVAEIVAIVGGVVALFALWKN